MICLECSFFITANSEDAFCAFNRIGKGISNFSHYPVNCGKWLLGVQRQTNVMQSSPHRQTVRERMEGDEQWKMERVGALKRVVGGDGGKREMDESEERRERDGERDNVDG